MTWIAIVLFSASVFAQVSPVVPSTDFVAIQPGTFKMGCSAGDMRCDPDENPPHQVKLTKPFQLAKFEVTQAQWKAVMGDNNPSRFKGDTLPVENISFDQVQEFLKSLNARNDGFVYRLPTEAEWEYVARAGTLGPNTGPLDEVAWHAGNSEMKSHPVGQKKPNAWGLYDMEGNVYEWTNDCVLRLRGRRGDRPQGPGNRVRARAPRRLMEQYTCRRSDFQSQQARTGCRRFQHWLQGCARSGQMKFNRRLFLALPALAPLRALGFESTEEHRFHYDHLIGTSMDLAVWTKSREAAQHASHAALNEIARLTRILSTYEPDSESGDSKTVIRSRRRNSKKSSNSIATGKARQAECCRFAHPAMH